MLVLHNTLILLILLFTLFRVLGVNRLADTLMTEIKSKVSIYIRKYHTFGNNYINRLENI